MSDSIRGPATESREPRRRHLEWAIWHARPDICPPGISLYVDLNTQGIHIGGSLWRVEGYVWFNWRSRSASLTSVESGK